MPDLLSLKGTLSEARHYPERISCDIVTTLVFKVNSLSIDTHWANHPPKNVLQHSVLPPCTMNVFYELICFSISIKAAPTISRSTACLARPKWSQQKLPSAGPTLYRVEQDHPKAGCKTSLGESRMRACICSFFLFGKPSFQRGSGKMGSWTWSPLKE